MKNRSFAKYLLLCLTLGLLLCGYKSTGCTVTFDANWEDGAALESQTVDAGQKVSAPESPVRDGYLFLGWFQDPELTQPWDMDEDTVLEDMTLYAGWEPDTEDTVSDAGNDKDFSAQTPDEQEKAYEYRSFFLPALDW